MDVSKIHYFLGFSKFLGKRISEVLRSYFISKGILKITTTLFLPQNKFLVLLLETFSNFVDKDVSVKK